MMSVMEMEPDGYLAIVAGEDCVEDYVVNKSGAELFCPFCTEGYAALNMIFTLLHCTMHNSNSAHANEI